MTFLIVFYAIVAAVWLFICIVFFITATMQALDDSWSLPRRRRHASEAMTALRWTALAPIWFIPAAWWLWTRIGQLRQLAKEAK